MLYEAKEVATSLAFPDRWIGHTHSPYWSSSGSFAISSFHLSKINLIIHGSRPKRLSTSFGLAMCTVQ